MKRVGKTEETDICQLHQSGIDYKSKIGYFTRSDLHWSFYNSDQWRGIDAKDLPKITINIVKQDINHKIASVMSQNIGIKYGVDNFSETDPSEEDSKSKTYSNMLTDHVKVEWERLKMNAKIRKVLLNAAVTGDMALFTYWDSRKETNQLEKGDINTIVLDGANVFFGDANTPEVENQPWIIISGRDTVKRLREEAKANGVPQDEVDSIVGDQDNEYQSGQYGKIEMDYGSDEGKATYFIKLWKENGTVMWCKKTRYSTIRKSVDMRIKRYPVNFNNWETIKNSMHGMDECRGVIPNQIAINQLNSMIVLWMRMNAFGKTAYDSTRISGWSNALATSIPVNGDITGAVQQLAPGNFNQAIVNYSDMLLQTTKSVLGVGDAALGQVDPRNTSAIAVAVKQSAIPLENVQANLYQLVEDWAYTVAEFKSAYYEDRGIPVNIEGKKEMVKFEKPPEGALLNVSIDVGPSSYYSEIAGMGTLDNLLDRQKITDKQYFERMKAFNIIPDIEGILKDLEQAEEDVKEMEIAKSMQAQNVDTEQPMAQQPQQPIDENAMFEEMLSSMSPEQQKAFMELSPEEQQALAEEYSQQ